MIAQVCEYTKAIEQNDFVNFISIKHVAKVE